MKYKDIFSHTISHFTEIPPEFVLGYLQNFDGVNDKNRDLLNYILDIDFPDPEGHVLLNDLKSGDLKSAITFFQNSLKIIKQEELRQSLVN